MIKRIKIQEKRTMTREEFITLSKDHILYLDGATGSNLVKAGMPSGVCPEQWILEHQGVMLQYPVCPYLYRQSRQTGRISSGKKYDFHDS